MKNIYLVGFMGTGKTVVGEILAKKLAKDFVEMDAFIEAKEGSEVVDIFAKKGEAYFRELEKELLKELSVKKDLVISCGGGLICDSENLNQLKETGVVFALQASVSTIYRRTKNILIVRFLMLTIPKRRLSNCLPRGLLTMHRLST